MTTATTYKYITPQRTSLGVQFQMYYCTKLFFSPSLALAPHTRNKSTMYIKIEMTPLNQYKIYIGKWTSANL